MSRRRSRSSNSDIPQCRWAQASVLMILVNVCLFVGLRNLDMLVLTLMVALVAALGWFFAIRARKQLRRRYGRMQGEGAAMLGYWGNLIIMLLFTFGFSWFFAMGILRGDLLI